MTKFLRYTATDGPRDSALERAQILRNSTLKAEVEGGFMPILKKLRELLDDAKVPYDVYSHPLAYTAQEIAATQHVSGDAIAKVVMLKVDGVLTMAVVRGSDKLSLATAEDSLNAREVQLATEDEFIVRFPGCEVGAMPPFGSLFGIPVYVDQALEDDEYIYFNAGNHVQTVRIKYADYEKLVHPRVVRLTALHGQRAA
jgi:Ala-tRNA(Pro) deacylase